VLVLSHPAHPQLTVNQGCLRHFTWASRHGAGSANGRMCP
jgi:hypothetical protein